MRSFGFEPSGGSVRWTGRRRSQVVASEKFDQSLKRRVASGVALLTEHWSENWADSVSSGNLDLHSPDRCVLGQIFGSFALGAATLRIRDEAAYGFAAEDSYEQARLEFLWRRAIAARRSAI